jgi:adenylate cyclase, class 2
MREIEIKARVSNKVALKKALVDRQIKLSKPVEQHDVVYYIEGTQDNAPDSVWLRLRTENKTKTILTLKKQHRGGLDSIEHETVVADADETKSIINALGFTLYSDLIKNRQKARIGDVEICLDEVEDLGTFVEAEKIADLDTDGKQVEKELWELFKSFGIDKADEVLEGYDVLHRAKTQK